MVSVTYFPPSPPSFSSSFSFSSFFFFFLSFLFIVVLFSILKSFKKGKPFLVVRQYKNRPWVEPGPIGQGLLTPAFMQQFTHPAFISTYTLPDTYLAKSLLLMGPLLSVDTYLVGVWKYAWEVEGSGHHLGGELFLHSSCSILPWLLSLSMALLTWLQF